MTPTTEATGIPDRAAGLSLRVSHRQGLTWVVASAFALALVVGGGVLILSQVRGETDPDRLWEEGQADFQAKRLDRAEAVLHRLARLRPASVKDSILRAEVEMARGRPEAALNALALVPDSDPMAPRARSQAGTLEFRGHHARAAEAQWKRAIAADPVEIEARRSLAYLYALQLRRSEFDAQFREIAARRPITFAHAYFWSQINCSIYDPSEARAELERFLEADPDDLPSRLALYEVYLKLERVADAERLLTGLPENDPDARAARARVALLKGDDSAVTKLLAPGFVDHPGLARLRGRQALIRHDAEAAVREYRAALAAVPDDHDALQGLARALRIAGDAEGARVYQERVRSQEQLWELVQRVSRGTASTDLNLLRRLGMTCAAANRPHEARAWYSLVIARDPLDAEAQRALYRLAAEPIRAPGRPGLPPSEP